MSSIDSSPEFYNRNSDIPYYVCAYTCKADLHSTNTYDHL